MGWFSVQIYSIWAGGFLKWKEFGVKVRRPGLESSFPSFNYMNLDN